ncbi:hypothetical protein MML48_3g00015850 [Holotrichia oblita]|uniref:Uncharacterized protein n=1 Tax=Holotrichia oblita TaxID=644536 RepID=A0ACB9TEA5_HOLOL|nr:hypothetical protein MML48_3g00015850 [Holotrichia oblita]
MFVDIIDLYFTITEQEYPVKTKIIVADFSKGATTINYIRNEINNLEIGILGKHLCIPPYSLFFVKARQSFKFIIAFTFLLSVNNVGMQYTYPMVVGEVPEQQLWDIININVGAVTMMTRILVEDMKKRKKGAIVNVSSGSELQPLPLMTVYAASKVILLLLLFICETSKIKLNYNKS